MEGRPCLPLFKAEALQPLSTELRVKMGSLAGVCVTVLLSLTVLKKPLKVEELNQTVKILGQNPKLES